MKGRPVVKKLTATITIEYEADGFLEASEKTRQIDQDIARPASKFGRVKLDVRERRRKQGDDDSADKVYNPSSGG